MTNNNNNLSTVRHTYYAYSPRGFSNELYVYRIPSSMSDEDKARFTRWMDDINNDINSWVYRVFRSEALEYCASYDALGRGDWGAPDWCLRMMDQDTAKLISDCHDTDAWNRLRRAGLTDDEIAHRLGS